jgi:hypothetical protein
MILVIRTNELTNLAGTHCYCHLDYEKEEMYLELVRRHVHKRPIGMNPHQNKKKQVFLRQSICNSALIEATRML